MFSLVLDPRGLVLGSSTLSLLLLSEVELEAWQGRLRVVVRNLRTLRVVYWVNVSESSGVSSPGLSWIKGR